MQTLENVGIFLIVLSVSALLVAFLIDRWLAWIAAGEPDVNGAPERDSTTIDD